MVKPSRKDKSEQSLTSKVIALSTGVVVGASSVMSCMPQEHSTISEKQSRQSNYVDQKTYPLCGVETKEFKYTKPVNMDIGGRVVSVTMTPNGPRTDDTKLSVSNYCTFRSVTEDDEGLVSVERAVEPGTFLLFQDNTTRKSYLGTIGFEDKTSGMRNAPGILETTQVIQTYKLKPNQPLITTIPMKMETGVTDWVVVRAVKKDDGKTYLQYLPKREDRRTHIANYEHLLATQFRRGGNPAALPIAHTRPATGAMAPTVMRPSARARPHARPRPRDVDPDGRLRSTTTPRDVPRAPAMAPSAMRPKTRAVPVARPRPRARPSPAPKVPKSIASGLELKLADTKDMDRDRVPDIFSYQVKPGLTMQLGIDLLAGRLTQVPQGYKVLDFKGRGQNLVNFADSTNNYVMLVSPSKDVYTVKIPIIKASSKRVAKRIARRTTPSVKLTIPFGARKQLRVIDGDYVLDLEKLATDDALKLMPPKFGATVLTVTPGVNTYWEAVSTFMKRFVPYQDTATQSRWSRIAWQHLQKTTGVQDPHSVIKKKDTWGIAGTKTRVLRLPPLPELLAMEKRCKDKPMDPKVARRKLKEYALRNLSALEEKCKAPKDKVVKQYCHGLITSYLRVFQNDIEFAQDGKVRLNKLARSIGYKLPKKLSDDPLSCSRTGGKKQKLDLYCLVQDGKTSEYVRFASGDVGRTTLTAPAGAKCRLERKGIDGREIALELSAYLPGTSYENMNKNAKGLYSRPFTVSKTSVVPMLVTKTKNSRRDACQELTYVVHADKAWSGKIPGMQGTYAVDPKDGIIKRIDQTKTSKGLPTWAKVLIGVGAGLATAGIVYGIYYGVTKHRRDSADTTGTNQQPPDRSVGVNILKW